MKTSIRITALLLALSILFLLVACSAPPPDLDPPDLDLGDETLEESYLEESYIKEQFIVRGEMTADEVAENRLVAAKIIEQTLGEDMIIEQLSVDVVRADQMQGLLDHYFTYETLCYQIDYASVGADLLEAGVVTLINAVVFSSLLGGPVGIVVAVAGTLAFATVASAISLIKAGIESGGNLGIMKKYAIEGYSSGAVFGAGVMSTIGAVMSTGAIASGTKVVTNAGKVLGWVDKGMKIIDTAGEVAGYVAQGGVALNKTGKVLGSIDKSGNLKDLVEPIILSEGRSIDLNGVEKYRVGEGGTVNDLAGNVIGFLNTAGMIIIPGGLVVGMITNGGRMISSFEETVRSGFKIGLSGKVMNDSYQEGANTYYLDEDGNVLGAEVKTVSSEGENISFLMKATDILVDNLPKVADAIFGDAVGAVVGILNSAGQLVSNWKENYRVERLAAVDRAWEMEKDLVLSGAVGTRAWSDRERAELISQGRVSGYVAHYINSPNHNPSLITNPDNIIFLSSAEHSLVLDGYDVDMPKYGELVNRSILP